MKARLWVLVVVLIIGLLAVGLHLGWRRARIDQKIEEFLLKRMAALSKAKVKVEDIHLGPRYVRLRGVVVEDERRGLILAIDQARLSFSLLDHIAGGFRSTAGLKEVFLSRPNLIVDVNQFLATREGISRSPFPFGGGFPERITVAKGSLMLVDAEGDGISALTMIDGWLEKTGNGQGSCRWTGSWGAPGAKNLLVSGTFHELLGEYSVHAELQEASLEPVLGSSLPARYSFDQGWIEFSLSVDKVPEAPQPEIQGRVRLEVDRLADGQLGVVLEELKARARLEGLEVVVEGVEAKVGGGDIKAQGRIAHLLEPIFHLRVEGQGLETARLLAKGVQQYREQLPQGAVSLSGDLEGSPEDLTFNGQLNASQLEVFGHRLTDLGAQVNIRGSHILLQNMKARLPWAVLHSRGEFDMAQSPAALEAEWRLEDIDLARATGDLNLGAIQGHGVMAGKLRGPVGGLHLRGGLRLTGLRGRWLPVEQLMGQFHWIRGRLSYHLESPDGQVLFRGVGTSWLGSSSHRADLQVRDVSLAKLIHGYGGRGRLCGHWIFSGSAARIRLEGEAMVEGVPGMRGRFDSWGEFFRRNEDRWCLDAVAVSHDWEIHDIPLSLKLNLSLDDQRLRLRELNINDELKMFGVMEMTGERRLKSQLSCDRLDTRWLGQLLLPASVHSRVGGFISGRLELAGTWHHPRARGEVEWLQGRLGHLDDLSLRLPLTFAGDTLVLNQAFLRRQGQRLMVLNGKVGPGGSLSLQAGGGQVQAGVLSRLLEEIPEAAAPAMGGVLDYRCRIDGDIRSPIFKGQMRWTQGWLKMLTFDDFELSIEGKEGRFDLKRFSLEEKDRRQISATGSIPYAFLGLPGGGGPEDGLDLSVHVEGDVLSLLSSFIPLVAEASGYGEADIRLGGTPGSLVLGSGRLRFQEGRIKPTIFVKELKNLRGWIEIGEEDDFVDIRDLTGEVGGCPVEVVNFRELEPGHGQLESLQIPGLGLNLGILGLETGEEGIEANLPGLMAPGEFGRIRLTGANLQGPFLLAGPLESPEVLGTLGLNHLDFTYPPHSSSEGAQLSFLREVNWDLVVVAQKDVWYQKDFADLRVEDTQSQLHFTGSARDQTLRVIGHVSADRGEVTYLDRQFQVVNLDLEFTGHEEPSLQGYDNRPLVSGEFEATVYSESTGVATDIFLNLYAIDPETGERTQRGRWGDFKVELSSSDPSDDTQGKVLAKLGYSGDYADKALHLLQVTLGPKLENHFIRPVLEPVERTIKRALGIDVIRFQPGLARNLLVQNERPPGADASLSRRLLFPRSSLLVGKYLTDNCFFSYLGKFRTRTDEFLDDRLGISHRFGLEFRLKGSTVLDLEYDYERDLTEGDKKVKTVSDKRAQITHNFPF
jgi:hypothetical protein